MRREILRVWISGVIMLDYFSELNIYPPMSCPPLIETNPSICEDLLLPLNLRYSTIFSIPFLVFNQIITFPTIHHENEAGKR
jgi:hypothetical protein